VESNKNPDLADKVAAIVLAGGQGTRLFPLTENRCKPAVSFGGRYKLIDIPLSNALNSHISRIFIVSQYFASELQQHILSTYHLDMFRRGGIEMLCPEETIQGKTWYNGTADAVRKNLEYIEKSPVDYYLILSGDQLYNIDFFEMVSFAKKTDADLLIACLPVEEKEARRMGLLKIDASAKVLEFVEKPSDPQILKTLELPTQFLKKCNKPADKKFFLGSMGIYIFKREALKALLKEEGDDFGRHLIPMQMQKGKTFAYLYDGYWEDIGTIGSYYEASMALTKQQCCLNTYDEHNPIFTHPHHLPSPLIKNTRFQNSMISLGAIIEAEEIIHSVIGPRAHIKKGSIIRDSVIMGNHFYTPPLHQNTRLPAQFSIGENCLIQKAIIDEHTFIGKGVQLINKNNLQTYDGNGIYIRDGIIIVTSGTQLPDNYVL